MLYYDAHCHLQDPRLYRSIDRIAWELSAAGVEKVVVNGTCEEDWERVSELAERFDFVVPSYGLHPWKAKAQGREGEEKLRLLLENRGAMIGEIGLDRWIAGYDLEDQINVFERQLEIAAELNRPVSIHCLRAWGQLVRSLKRFPELGGRLLVHSFGGSYEVARELLSLDARFSLSAYFFLEKKRDQLEVFKRLPLDRLLLETDSPDMLGPETTRIQSLFDEDGEQINHPVNIVGVYREWALALAEEPLELGAKMNRNFEDFFGRTNVSRETRKQI